MKITKLVSNILQSNTFLIENKYGQVLIVDCGCDLKRVIETVGDKKVVGILLTHGHFDHCAYCNDYAQYFNCKIHANKKIKETMTDKIAIYNENYEVFENFDNFEFLEKDRKLEIGLFKVCAYSLSGHSHCSEGYLINKNFFVGDFLFAKSFGRIDLKFSNLTDMLYSFNKLKDIDFDILYSGHGEESSREEQIKNIQLYKKFLLR